MVQKIQRLTPDYLEVCEEKKGRKIFEIFSSEGQSEFWVASRARWDEHQRVLVTQEEESRRKAHEVDYEVIRVGQQCTNRLPVGY